MRAHILTVMVAGLCCALSFAAAAKDPTPRLDAIEVRLLYKTKGVLSDNVAPPARFTGFNTVLGEGDAKEPADDVLVVVRLSVTSDEANSDTPLTIKATDGRGKPLGQRTIKSQFFKGGKTIGALFLPDATCSGTLHIQATFGAQKKTSDVAFRCGE